MSWRAFILIAYIPLSCSLIAALIQPLSLSPPAIIGLSVANGMIIVALFVVVTRLRPNPEDSDAHRPSKNHPAQSTHLPNRHCDKCNQSVTRVPFVGSSDGRLFCFECIEHHGWNMVLPIGSPEIMHETMPHSGWRVAAGMFAFSTTLFGVPSCIVSLITWSPLPLVVTLIIASPAIALFTIGVGIAFHFNRPSVTIRDGMLTVRNAGSTVSASVDDCNWFVGSMSQVTMLNYGFLIGGAAIIIEFPREVAPRGNRIAVGFTEVSRDVWRHFLTKSGVALKA